MKKVVVRNLLYLFWNNVTLIDQFRTCMHVSTLSHVKYVLCVSSTHDLNTTHNEYVIDCCQYEVVN